MRGRSLQLIGLAVSVVCVAGVVYWASKQPAPRFPSDAEHWLYLLGAVGLYALNTLVRGERWHRLLVDDGARPGRVDSHALNVVGYTGNNLLPARAGDAVRVLLMAPRAQASKRTVIGTLLAERLLDVVVIVVLFIVVGYGVLDEVGGGELEVIGGVTLLAILGAIAAFFLVRRNERLAGAIGPMLTSTRNLLSRDGVPLVGMTLTIWLLETFVWMAVGAAASFGMTLLEGLYLVALSSIFSLIPSGPAYAGTQDTAALIGVKAIGASGSLATTYLILLAARYGGVGRLRRARLEEAIT